MRSDLEDSCWLLLLERISFDGSCKEVTSVNSQVSFFEI